MRTFRFRHIPRRQMFTKLISKYSLTVKLVANCVQDSILLDEILFASTETAMTKNGNFSSVAVITAPQRSDLNRKLLLVFLLNGFMVFSLFYLKWDKKVALHVTYKSLQKSAEQKLCFLPILDPWDPKVRGKVNPDAKEPECNPNIKPRSFLDGRELTIEPDMEGCEYACISKKPGVDSRGSFDRTEWTNVFVSPCYMQLFLLLVPLPRTQFQLFRVSYF